MSSNASANEIDEFLNGALITWLESCLTRPELLNGYQSLFDATIFHTVWRNIDPELQFYPQPLTDLDETAIPIVRAKNFDNVIRNMRALYEEELGQTILVVPDCMILGHAPESKAGLEQMKLLFTLLLGAAVQCPNKQFFIARIKELDVNTQHAIVDIIKSVTDSQTLVLNTDTLDSERRYNLNVDHLIDFVVRIARERDKYHTDWMSHVTPNANDSKFCASESPANQTAVINSDQNHLAVELADLKSKLRKLRQDLDEKTDAYLQAKQELEHKNSQYEKLRRETQEWYAESCRASAEAPTTVLLRGSGNTTTKISEAEQYLNSTAQ